MHQKRGKKNKLVKENMKCKAEKVGALKKEI